MIRTIARCTLITVFSLLWISVTGCGTMLDQQAAKDRDLGKMVEENVKSNPQLMANFVSFTNLAPGEYQAVVKNINSAEDAGKMAYNLMVVLDERNNTKVQTGRNKFTIYGEQEGTRIFEVVYGSGYVTPQVTLKGPYEGIAWSRQ